MLTQLGLNTIILCVQPCVSANKIAMYWILYSIVGHIQEGAFHWGHYVIMNLVCHQGFKKTPVVRDK